MSSPGCKLHAIGSSDNRCSFANAKSSVQDTGGGGDGRLIRHSAMTIPITAMSATTLKVIMLPLLQSSPFARPTTRDRAVVQRIRVGARHPAGPCRQARSADGPRTEQGHRDQPGVCWPARAVRRRSRLLRRDFLALWRAHSRWPQGPFWPFPSRAPCDAIGTHRSAAPAPPLSSRPAA